jgi:hypothetical protein
MHDGVRAANHKLSKMGSVASQLLLKHFQLSVASFQFGYVAIFHLSQVSATARGSNKFDHDSCEGRLGEGPN